ncbi:hypothetical protein RUND412_001006 [Rhizina undulata]
MGNKARALFRYLNFSFRFQSTRSFSAAAAARGKSRIYDSIRNEGDFHTALRLTTAANIPLITMWTASYCPTCKTVGPLLEDIVEKRGGDRDPVGLALVEVDAQGGNVGELAMRYMIRSLPTFITFRRGEPNEEKRMVDTRIMTRREKLEEWVEEVAKQGTGFKGGNGWLGGVFGN